MDARTVPTRVVSLLPVVSIRKSGDSAVVLNTESAELYSCNRTASAFLDEVDGRRTLAEIVEAMLPTYDGDPLIIRAELVVLADRLSAIGIISLA